MLDTKALFYRNYTNILMGAYCFKDNEDSQVFQLHNIQYG